MHSCSSYSSSLVVSSSSKKKTTNATTTTTTTTTTTSYTIKKITPRTIITLAPAPAFLFHGCSAFPCTGACLWQFTPCINDEYTRVEFTIIIIF